MSEIQKIENPNAYLEPLPLSEAAPGLEPSVEIAAESGSEQQKLVGILGKAHGFLDKHSRLIKDGSEILTLDGNISASETYSRTHQPTGSNFEYQDSVKTDLSLYHPQDKSKVTFSLHEANKAKWSPQTASEGTQPAQRPAVKAFTKLMPRQLHGKGLGKSTINTDPSLSVLEATIDHGEGSDERYETRRSTPNEPDPKLLQDFEDFVDGLDAMIEYPEADLKEARQRQAKEEGWIKQAVKAELGRIGISLTRPASEIEVSRRNKIEARADALMELEEAGTDGTIRRSEALKKSEKIQSEEDKAKKETSKPSRFTSWRNERRAAKRVKTFAKNNRKRRELIRQIPETDIRQTPIE